MYRVIYCEIDSEWECGTVEHENEVEEFIQADKEINGLQIGFYVVEEI